MKTQSLRLSLLAMLLVELALLVSSAALGQNNLVLEGKLFKNGKCDKTTFIVQVIKDRTDVVEYTNVRKDFKLSLEYGHNYTVIIYSEGCQPKYIKIDTNGPVNRREKYEADFYLKTSTDQTLYYAGGIFYNDEKKQFDYFQG
jgi:hypothetical protein